MRKKVREYCGITEKWLPPEVADEYYDAYNRQFAERVDEGRAIADEMYAEGATGEQIRDYLTRLQLPVPKEFLSKGS